jgi:hypothetical protein
MKQYADATAHNSIPDEYLPCLMTRRHTFPMKRQHEQKVRIQYGDGKADVLELFESVGTCEQCGCERTLWRDQLTNRFVGAEYKRPDGYEPPPGQLWDREQLWEIYRKRNPIKGRPRVIDRRPA